MAVILGLSAYYHDSAAALLIDGELAAASQEERFTRHKHDAGFPVNAICSVLETAGVSLQDVDHISFHESFGRKLDRQIKTFAAFFPQGISVFPDLVESWFRGGAFQRRRVLQDFSEHWPDVDIADRLLPGGHHVSHAASAFYPSPFDRAVILTLDGIGEWATTTVSVGEGNRIERRKEIRFPHSLGLLYAAVTAHLGFRVNSGEYKVMGLAPYGNPRFADLLLEKVIDVKPDGSFRLDMRYFDYCVGRTMTNGRFSDLVGIPSRTPETRLNQKHMDLAASIQRIVEVILLKLARSLRDEFNISNLCLSGGVALNCVANGVILREAGFDGLWIQPAAGDAGNALGAALWTHFGVLGNHRSVRAGHDSMQGAYVGPQFEQADIERRLSEAGARFQVIKDEQLLTMTVRALAEDKAVGWFQGRMEFGPRSLGNRSILGNPRSPTMQKNLNLKVKYRESFRPFAPSVLAEYCSSWFEMEEDSPYMLLVASVKAEKCRKMTGEENKLFGIDKLNVLRSEIPAVTHVDYSARVQTVHADTNPRFHRLLSAFHERTGCPVLINTSFNVRGEPIVCTPEDAFRCFMGTDLDTLVVGNCILDKEIQDQSLRHDYKNAFELD